MGPLIMHGRTRVAVGLKGKGSTSSERLIFGIEEVRQQFRIREHFREKVSAFEKRRRYRTKLAGFEQIFKKVA